MKKLALTLAIVLGLGMASYAEGGGLFGQGQTTAEESSNTTMLYNRDGIGFPATVNDNAARFTLVFAHLTGIEENNTNTFAFFSNGNFIIANQGNATLQVVDLNGRILKSEVISDSASVNVDAAPGVYMIRLINGDNVKVQKIVVR